jgi:hypothetical protein
MSDETFMPRVNGEPFHCEECGSNCFHRYSADPNRYECNGCGTRYLGDPSEGPEADRSSLSSEGRSSTVVDSAEVSYDGASGSASSRSQKE